jgi:hypothetical protein
VKKQDIENIELGHRQLLFDFEKDKAKEQAVVMSCIKNQTEKYGHVVLDELVQYVREVHDLLDFTIIQNVFWLTEDLKFHFRIDGKNLEPRNVKQTLIQSVEQSVKIVPNKSVTNSVFQDVKRLYQELSEEKGFDDCDDQYEFARLLAKKIKGWEVILKSYKSAAQKPFFPCEKEIDDCMRFIKKISVKLDSFSLINAFYDNKERVLKLSDDVKIISEFYTQHIDFWKSLIQSFEAFNDNLSESIKDADIVAGFEKLKQILSASAPYNMIAEAKTLQKKVTQQCRVALSAIIDNMIEETKAYLDAHKAGQNLRNKSLYSLRTIKKRISEAKNIKSMNLCLIDAEEKLDVFWDEIKR